MKEKTATTLSKINLYAQRLKLLKTSWVPHDGQKKILRAVFNDGVKRVFIQAGRKWGKSELCMYAAWRIAVLQDKASVYIVGPTRKQQVEIMWATSRLQDFGGSCGQQEMESDVRIKYPWKSFIKIDGSENFEAYRGTEYDLMIFDEFKDCDYRFYEAAYPNLLAKDGIIIVIGTPPDSETHYIKLRDQINGDPSWRFFHATSWENPHISHEWLKREKKAYYERGDGAIWEREFEARFIPGGANAVFPMFSYKHVRPRDVLEAEILRDRRKMQWYTISDPGTSSVFCVLFIAYNPYTSQIYVMDEIYERDRNETTTSRIWERVKVKQKELCPEISENEWINVYDEAAAWFAVELSNSFGIGAIPTRKQAADKENQISLIKDMLSRDEVFKIADCCKHTAWEIRNYITDESGRYVKKNDHAIDDLRYFADISGYTFDIEKVYAKKRIEGPRAYTPEMDAMLRRQEEDPFAFLETASWTM